MTFAMPSRTPIREWHGFHEPPDYADRDRISVALCGHNLLKNERQHKLSFLDVIACGTTFLSINHPANKENPMKQPSVYLKMRVLGAVDTVEGRTRHERNPPGPGSQKNRILANLSLFFGMRTLRNMSDFWREAIETHNSFG